MTDSIPPIGGGADEDVVRATASEDLGSIPVAPQSDPLAFADAVASYCRKWFQRAEKRKGVTAFVSDTRSHWDDEERVYAFQKSYGEQLDGCIHRGDPSLTRVLRTADHGSTIAGLANAIVSGGLGMAPTVLVDLEEGELTVYPAGLEAEETAQTLLVGATESVIGGATVREFLDRFHHICTRVPTPGIQLWANAAHGVPVQRIEEVLGNYLVLSARWSFEDVYIRPELVTEEGRADVLIGPAKAAVGEPCLLELKVLRDRAFHADWKKARRYTPKEHEDWLAKGVDQAETYRGVTEADVAFLCCYDMRDDDGDEILDCVRDTAKEKDIILLRYYVTRSHEDSRRRRPGSAYSKLKDSRRN